MKKSVMLAAALLAGVALTGCNSSTEVVACGVANTNLVTKIVLNAEGKTVKSAKVDECYFLTEAAKLGKDESTLKGGEVLTVEGSKGNTYYSKYMKIGDTVYTGSVREEAYNGEAILWTTEGVADYFKTVESSSEEALKYFNALVEDKTVSMAKADGTAIDHKLGYVDSYTTPNKSAEDSTYWVQSDIFPLGWKGNIAKMEAAMVGVDFSTMPTITMDEESKHFFVNNVDSGATITKFEAYFTLVYDTLNA